ncbi:hypothetical protein FDP41_003095 [Naegleria fowleri]|uniref:Uncharacterized protein n=1 Tax=Naegleria fowleri TaxID=5763 RepID=A0A6A5BIP1_NAEFO|nr:uncharacterized protein FDP41_003095 [Naegleria fowleri]KAF0977773.1 hypothetical protein FDP41_003095 [Naegleria fowleri]
MQTENVDSSGQVDDEFISSSSLISLEFIVPKIEYSNNKERAMSEICTQIYEQVQREYHLYLTSELHDIRHLSNKQDDTKSRPNEDWNSFHQNKDISRQYEEFTLSHRDTFNWNQIKQALKHDNLNLSHFQTIEEANIFNPPSEEDETLSQSLPLTAEYWRRRQQELSGSSTTNNTFYEIPKLRIQHRIHAPRVVKRK